MLTASDAANPTQPKTALCRHNGMTGGAMETVVSPFHSYGNTFAWIAKKALDKGLADALTQM